MAKRFTDTDKWKLGWFRRLPVKMKAAWEYLRDNCDHAGIWAGDFELMSYQVGEGISVFECEQAFGRDRFIPLPGEKFFLPEFIEVQYGKLNPENRIHKSVLFLLEKEGVSKVFGNPFQRRKDKDKDKDKDQDKEKEQDKDKNKSDLDALYQAYPRKKGKSAGLKKLAKELKTPESVAAFGEALERFKSHHRQESTEPRFIPYFSTFVSEWRDWLDPQTGTVETPRPRGIAEILADEGAA